MIRRDLDSILSIQNGLSDKIRENDELALKMIKSNKGFNPNYSS